MNVLIVKTHHYWYDGITNVIRNLHGAMDLTGMQMDCVVVAEPEAGFASQFRTAGGNIYRLERSMRHPLRYVNRLAKLLEEGDYHILHIHGNSATMVLELLAAKKAGCPVRIAHGHNTHCLHEGLNRVLKPLFLSLCTHPMACGREAGQWLYGKRSFTVVNNGIDTERFSFKQADRQSVRQSLGFGDETVIGHVGTFNERKNQRFLIELLPRLGEGFRLLLIGDGEKLAECKTLANELGVADKVVFTGAMGDVAAHLSAMDAFVLPSLAEGLPLTLVEAQANGLPCLAADTVTKEADRTGLLSFVSLEDGADAWAAAIRELSGGDRAENSRQAVSKIRAGGYDIKEEAARLKLFYQQALTEGK